MTGSSIARVPPRRRLAALGALLSLLAALVVVVVALRGDLGRALVVLVLLLAAVGLAWSAATHRGPSRLGAAALALVGLAAAVAVVLTSDAHGLLVLPLVVLVAASVSMTRVALGHDPASLAEAETPGEPVGPERRGVLIMNLK